MREKSSILFAGITVATIALSSLATAQAPVSLQEQLNAQYKHAKMGADSGGTALVEAGTLLAVQKGGVLSVPWNALALCPAKFQDNSLHPSAGFCAAMVKSVSKYYQVGDKVYPMKIEVSLDKAKISFMVVACDSCNGVNPPSSMKGQVVFQFAKGYLEKANVGEVEDVIGQVFAISNDDQQGQGGNDQGQQGGQQQDQQQQQQQPQQQQAEPAEIKLGMTPDQVENAVGKPDKKITLGPKQIYVYKDMKVTFKDGKVSDVQ